MFGLPAFRMPVHSLADIAMHTDKAMVLAAHSLETLRQKRIILPALSVIERACAEAVTRANRRIYCALIDPLERHHKRSLDNLLNVAPDMSISWLVWLRQSPLKPTATCANTSNGLICSSRWPCRTGSAVRFTRTGC